MRFTRLKTRRYQSGFISFILTAVLVAVNGCAYGSGADGMERRTSTESAWQSKLNFNLERLNADGLQGPPDGLRALHYEYCIPDQPGAIRAVSAIDPTLEIQQGSPGRVGCYQGRLLCLGHTHQPDYLAVLERLAMLAMVDAIHENFFE